MSDKDAETELLPVVYEDREILIVHKHSGLPSTFRGTEPRSGEDSAVARVRRQALTHHSSGVDLPECGLLHRLDNDTSGLLAFAKTPATYERLRAAWETQTVNKIYRAIVHSSESRPTELEIHDPIAHSAKSSKKMIVLKSGRRTPKSAIRGKPQAATTRILLCSALSKDHWAVTVQILTGVRHQIRAHLSAYGMPIVGDPVYKGPAHDRLMLHAWKLELPLESGVRLCVESELPLGFGS